MSQPRGANFTIDGQLHRVAEMALPRALRAARRNDRVAGHLRRAAGDVPGLARRDLRALPGPGRQLVLPDLHGRRRVRLRPAVFAARAGPRRSVERGPARRTGGGGHSRPDSSGGAASAVPRDRRVRAAHRQSGMAPLRALLGRRCTKAAPRSSWWCAASRRSATTTTWSTGSFRRTASFAWKSV